MASPIWITFEFIWENWKMEALSEDHAQSPEDILTDLEDQHEKGEITLEELQNQLDNFRSQQ